MVDSIRKASPEHSRRVKLVSGLLSADKALLTDSKKILQKYFGPIELESPIIPFDFTNFYNDELGTGILRQYISFIKLIRPEYISKIKRLTIRLERKFAINGKRKVNIDPGFVSLDKLVLATTKDAAYRIYIGKGIYAQSTLYFQQKTFHPWPWTYKDYSTNMSVEFFNKVRVFYKTALK